MPIYYCSIRSTLFLDQDQNPCSQQAVKFEHAKEAQPYRTLLLSCHGSLLAFLEMLLRSCFTSQPYGKGS